MSLLLRRSLESDRRPHAPLREELDFVERYLQIEQTRFGERLAYRCDADHEVLDSPVPTLLLQPLVENAVKHGIAPSPLAGRIELRCYRIEDDLHIEITNSRPEHPGRKDASHSLGLGLSTTRDRLLSSYPGRARLIVGDRRPGEFSVLLRLPFSPPIAP
jgi:sensor histidine kinase YesM